MVYQENWSKRNYFTEVSEKSENILVSDELQP